MCSNPGWGTQGPEVMYRPTFYLDWSKDECKERCLNEYRCIEAFYFDLRAYSSVRACTLHFESIPCLSYEVAYWFDPVHWKATSSTLSTSAPTSAPTSKLPSTPTSTPTSPISTSAPSTRELCPSSNVLLPEVSAGYHCFKDGSATGMDSNEGFSSEDCTNTHAGVWREYTCLEAEDYWLSLPGKC